MIKNSLFYAKSKDMRAHLFTNQEGRKSGREQPSAKGPGMAPSLNPTSKRRQNQLGGQRPWKAVWGNGVPGRHFPHLSELSTVLKPLLFKCLKFVFRNGRFCEQDNATTALAPLLQVLQNTPPGMIIFQASFTPCGTDTTRDKGPDMVVMKEMT